MEDDTAKMLAFTSADLIEAQLKRAERQSVHERLVAESRDALSRSRDLLSKPRSDFRLETDSAPHDVRQWHVSASGLVDRRVIRLG
jgi:hypothetical protein